MANVSFKTIWIVLITAHMQKANDDEKLFYVLLVSAYKYAYAHGDKSIVQMLHLPLFHRGWLKVEGNVQIRERKKEKKTNGGDENEWEFVGGKRKMQSERMKVWGWKKEFVVNVNILCIGWMNLKKARERYVATQRPCNDNPKYFFSPF